MGACLRAVRLDKQDLLRPPPITFPKAKKHIPVVQQYLQEAQEKLVSLNSTVPWPHLPSFTDTFNQAARSYMTDLILLPGGVGGVFADINVRPHPPPQKAGVQ
jgi:hypothetical protein